MMVREKLNTNFAKVSNKLVVAMRERDEAMEKAERYRLEANKFMLQRDEIKMRYDELLGVAVTIAEKKEGGGGI